MATKKQREKLIKDQTKAGAKELLPLLRTARANIEKLILDYAKLDNFVAAASVRAGLYSQITTQYIQLNGGIDDWIEHRSDAVAKPWHAMAIDDMPEAIAKGAPTFNQFSKKYLTDIIDSINPSTSQSRIKVSGQLGGMLNSDVRLVREVVTNVIQEGAVQGWTNKQLAAEYQSRILKANKDWAFIDKAGRKWSADSYFSMLNETVHATVARDTYAATGTEAGIDLYRIVGGPSTGPASDPCNAWDGKVISMTGATAGYPTYADALAAGVFHPRCIHSLAVYTEGLSDE